MLKLFGKLLDSNEKEIRRLTGIVAKINSFEDSMQKVKESAFSKKTEQLKERLKNGELLDSLLPEAFALVREASKRMLNQRHYDVQLMAAITLHNGKIAEQKTGEGKTLSAIPALYLNALSGMGVHLVTVNDYLARRDAGWMGPIFHLLGMKVSAIISERSYVYDPSFTDESMGDWRLKHLRLVSRREAYEADITYGINSEFGFDYLRDNMVSDISQMVQRSYHYAVVDEVDSVLIDEARTPHIISAPASEATHKYYDYAHIVGKLTAQTDYQVDEKLKTVHLTDVGIGHLEGLLGMGNIYENDFETVHHVEAALKARSLFHNNKEYIVKDNQVVIVDEFTGRLLQGRRFSEGIHQAIEAKEGVPIQQESRTLATVSLQNYFRMYEKLSGMTGTATTEAEEFGDIYKLDVVAIPTHRKQLRLDEADSVYKTTRAKYAAIVEDAAASYKKGQPVLIGTTSIEKNEIVSELLKKKGIPHQVLNAKNHLQEASIIAEAGKKGAVTVATNMAGRGVDIILGGSKRESWEYDSEKTYEKDNKTWQKLHDEVVYAGGLRVIGTERHESRRIDNQLRGRSGRQGDPGSSRFYVSLEDDIMRLFGGDQVAKIMTFFKLPEDVPLEHGMVTRSIEQAQVKVEGFHFDSRKHLVKYDDVLTKQREIVYSMRKAILLGDNQHDEILKKISESIHAIVVLSLSDRENVYDFDVIIREFAAIIPFDPNSLEQIKSQLETKKNSQEMIELLTTIAFDMYKTRETQISEETMRQIERWVSLSVIDQYWMEHLDAIDDLREGIGLRGYGQRDPLVEYKNEAFNLFERLMSSIDSEIVHRIFKIQVQSEQMNSTSEFSPINKETAVTKLAKKSVGNGDQQLPKTVKNGQKIGRNDPCWCGSGKKWKKCHYPQQA